LNRKDTTKLKRERKHQSLMEPSEVGGWRHPCKAKKEGVSWVEESKKQIKNWLHALEGRRGVVAT